MANTDYDKVIDKYKDMLQVRKENGDIDINDFLPDINDMIKEDCIWDVFNSFQKELSDEDDNVEDVAYFTEAPPITTPGYYEDSQCFVLRVNGNKLAITDKEWELGNADGDTWPFYLNDLNVGGSFTINGNTYSSFKDYAISNNILTDKIAVRSVAIDASEILHYTTCLVPNDNMNIVTVDYHTAVLRGYTVMPYKLNRNGSNKPSDWSVEEYSDNDYMSFVEYNGSYFQIAKDMKASDYGVSDKDGYTSYVIVGSSDWGKETLLDGYKAQQRAKEILESGKIKDMIVILDRNTVIGERVSGTGSRYYNSFFFSYRNVGTLVKELFNGETMKFSMDSLSFLPFGCDCYGRMLGNIWVKMNSEGGEQWINLSKYVLTGSDFTENNPSFAGTAMSGIYGGASDIFKKWNDTSNEFRYVDELNADGVKSYEDRLALHKHLTKIDFKIARDHTVLLGDTLFLIPPEAIHTSSTMDYEREPILRGKGSMMKNRTNIEELIELELYFNNEYGINGIPYEIETPSGQKLTYYMNGLRALISQFKVAPFLPIENHYINDVLNIEVVSLVNISISTVDGFPKLLKVVLTLREFNYRVFMPDLPVPNYDSESAQISEMQHVFAKMFDWELFRYYYQRGILNGEKLESYTYNTFPYNEFLYSNKNVYKKADLTDSNIEFFIPDVTWLKYALQVKKAKDRYGNYDSEELNKALQEIENGENVNSESSGTNATNYAATIQNGNKPKFNDNELNETGVERYSNLDGLGRCGAAFAVLGKETMPKDGEERGDISSVTPSGWNQRSYESLKTDDNSSGSIYNRCHLIGWQLSAENANEKNLITGTRYLNVGTDSEDPIYGGMLYYENLVRDYLDNNPNNHVAFRATPKYNGNNLVPSGVQLEGYSVEDKGAGICFNVYIPNVQPGFYIDYTDGTNKQLADSTKEILYDYYHYFKPENMKFVPYIADENGKSYPIELDAITVNMANYFTETHLKACKGYAPQYMGGSDVMIEIKATISDEYFIGAFKNLPNVIMELIRNYRRVMPCFPLKVKNEYLQMIGVNEVVLDNVTVSTIPGQPEVFDLTMKFTSVDRSMRQREALSKVDNSGQMTSSSAAYDIQSYFNLQESLAAAELYPDLDLPRIDELKELGWRFAKWSNEHRKYVDPDFYICYSFAYTSRLIKELVDSVLNRVIYSEGKVHIESKDGSYSPTTEALGLTSMGILDNYNIGINAIPGSDNNGLTILSQNGTADDYDDTITQIQAAAHAERTLKKTTTDGIRVDQARDLVETLNYLTALGIENGWQISPGWYAPLCSSYINDEMEKYDPAQVDQEAQPNEDENKFIIEIYDMRTKAIRLINDILSGPITTSHDKQDDILLCVNDAIESIFGSGSGKELIDLLCPMVDNGTFTENKVEASKQNDSRLRLTSEFFDMAIPKRWLQGFLFSLACLRSGAQPYSDKKEEESWFPQQWVEVTNKKPDFDNHEYYGTKHVPNNKVTQGRGVAGDGIQAEDEVSALTDTISYGAGQISIYNIETIKSMLQPESKIKYFNDGHSYNHMYNLTKKAGRKRFCETGFIDTYYNFQGYKSSAGKDFAEKITHSATANLEALMREVLVHLKRLIMDGFIFSEVDVISKDWESILEEILDDPTNFGDVLVSTADKNTNYFVNSYHNDIVDVMDDGKTKEEVEEENQDTSDYRQIAENLKEEIPRSYAKLFCSRLIYPFIMAACHGHREVLDIFKARNYATLDVYTLSSSVGGSNNASFNRFLGYMVGSHMIRTSELMDTAECTSNTQKAFNTLMSEAYTALSSDPKCYALHSFYDMCTTDKRGRLVRAFPCYYIFFVDEGRNIGTWKLFDNFYNMSSISNLQVVKSRKIPADTCTFTMSNMFMSYADTYDNTIYQQYVDVYGFKDTFDSIFSPTSYIAKEDAIRRRKQLADTNTITPGVRIHVRMGYGSDGSKLPIVFNGKVAEINCGETVEIVAQGDGHELNNPLNALGDLTAINLDESQSWTTILKDIRGSLARGGQTPRNLLAKIATAQHGGVIKTVIREYSNGRWFYDNPFGIYHFGDKRFKDIFVDSEIVQNMYEVSNKTMLNGTNDLLDDPSTVNAAPIINCNIQDKTAWEIGHLCANSGDDFYFAVRDFGLRSTMCLCRANHYYAYEYRKNETTGVIAERRKPFQQYHYYDSYNDIIYNSLKASETNMKTNAVGTWEGTDYLWGTSQQSVGPIYLDMNIYPEYQKSMMVETGLVAGGDGFIDIPILNALSEKYNYDEYQGRVNKSLAEKVTTNVLRQSVKDMYEGEICIIADPSLKPYDRVTIVDMFEDIAGDVEVETVIHSMNIETGFTTTFIPDLIVRVENTAQECGYQGVLSSMILGLAGITLKGGIMHAAAGTSGLIKLGSKGLVSLGGKFFAEGASTAILANPVALASAGIGAACVYMLTQNAKEMFTRFCRNIQALTVFPITKNNRLLIAGMSGHRGSVFGYPYTGEQAKNSIQGFIMNFTSLEYDSVAADLMGVIFNFVFSDDNYKVIQNKWKNNLGLTDNEDIIQSDASSTRNRESFNQFLTGAASKEYTCRNLSLAAFKTKPRINSFNTNGRTSDIYLKYQIGGLNDKTPEEVASLQLDDTGCNPVSVSELATNERIKHLIPIEDDPDIKMAVLSNDTHPVLHSFEFAHSKSYLTFNLKMENENTIIRYIAEGSGEVKIFDLPMLQEDALMVLKLILNMDHLKGKTVTFLSGTRVNDTNSWKSTGFWFSLHCTDMTALEAASKEVKKSSSWMEGKYSFAYNNTGSSIQYTVYAPTEIVDNDDYRSNYIGEGDDLNG